MLASNSDNRCSVTLVCFSAVVGEEPKLKECKSCSWILDPVSAKASETSVLVGAMELAFELNTGDGALDNRCSSCAESILLARQYLISELRLLTRILNSWRRAISCKAPALRDLRLGFVPPLDIAIPMDGLAMPWLGLFSLPVIVTRSGELHIRWRVAASSAEMTMLGSVALLRWILGPFSKER